MYFSFKRMNLGSLDQRIKPLAVAVWQKGGRVGTGGGGRRRRRWITPRLSLHLVPPVSSSFSPRLHLIVPATRRNCLLKYLHFSRLSAQGAHVRKGNASQAEEKPLASPPSHPPHPPPLLPQYLHQIHTIRPESPGGSSQGALTPHYRRRGAAAAALFL